MAGPGPEPARAAVPVRLAGQRGCPRAGRLPRRADGVAGLAAAVGADVFPVSACAVCVVGGCLEGEQAGVVPAEVQHGGDPFQDAVAEPARMATRPLETASSTPRPRAIAA